MKLQIDQYEIKHTGIRQIGEDPISVVLSYLSVDALKNFGKSAPEFQHDVRQEAVRRLDSTGLDTTKYTGYQATISALEKQDQLDKLLWRPVAAGSGGFAIVVTDGKLWQITYTNQVRTLIALDTKGRIFGWGNNDNGQLGERDKNEQDEVFLGPVHMELSGETTVRVAACTNNTYALNARGQLFQWGVMEDEYGQYTRDPKPSYIGPRNTTVTMGSFVEQNIIVVTKENGVMQIYTDVDENNYPTSEDAPCWDFIGMECDQQSIVNGKL